MTQPIPLHIRAAVKRLIVYDLDGTLVETLRDINEAANHMLRSFCQAPLPPDEIRRSVGRGLHELVRQCLKTADRARIEQGARLSRRTTPSTCWITAARIPAR